MGNLWMAFVYPGSFLSLLGLVLLIIGYQRRRTGRRNSLESVAQPGPPAPGGPGTASFQREVRYSLMGGILLGLGLLLFAALGVTSLVR